MRPDGKLTDEQRKYYIALCEMAKKGLKGGEEEMAFISTLSAYVRSHEEPDLAAVAETAWDEGFNNHKNQSLGNATISKGIMLRFILKAYT